MRHKLDLLSRMLTKNTPMKICTDVVFMPIVPTVLVYRYFKSSKLYKRN